MTLSLAQHFQLDIYSHVTLMSCRPNDSRFKYFVYEHNTLKIRQSISAVFPTYQSLYFAVYRVAALEVSYSCSVWSSESRTAWWWPPYAGNSPPPASDWHGRHTRMWCESKQPPQIVAVLVPYNIKPCDISFTKFTKFGTATTTKLP